MTCLVANAPPSDEESEAEAEEQSEAEAEEDGGEDERPAKKAKKDNKKEAQPAATAFPGSSTLRLSRLRSNFLTTIYPQEHFLDFNQMPLATLQRSRPIASFSFRACRKRPPRTRSRRFSNNIKGSRKSVWSDGITSVGTSSRAKFCSPTYSNIVPFSVCRVRNGRSSHHCQDGTPWLQGDRRWPNDSCNVR